MQTYSVMKSLPHFFALAVLIFGSVVIPASDVFGQIPGSSAREIPTEVQKSDPRVDQVIGRANDHFRRGKLALEDNKRGQARDEFDKAVDEILVSGLDVRASQRLQTFYLELVERIYREEVPTMQQAPQQTAMPVVAQDAPNPVSTTPKKGIPLRTAGGYSWQPFDPSVTRLPAGFHGHDLAKIYELINKQRSIKSEFETTERFQQRLATETTKPLIGSLSLQSVLAFVTNHQIESTYDADKQILHVTVKLETIDASDATATGDYGRSIDWGAKPLPGNNTYYIGMNAFGVKTRVRKESYDFFELGFDNYREFPIIGYDEGFGPYQNVSFAADLGMDSQLAMRSKTNLRLLLVCRPTQPYKYEGAIYEEATINYPVKRSSSLKYLYTHLLEFWFFDISTGQVFEKQKGRLSKN